MARQNTITADETLFEAENLQIDATSELSLLEIVNDSLRETYDYLRRFRFDPRYTEKLETVFGNDFDREIANQLFNEFAEGNFGNIPTIQLVNRDDLNGANAAFSQDTNLIYLSLEFITDHLSPEFIISNNNNVQAITQTIADVLLEEIGHYVDAQINVTDAPGDEGDIFSKLIQGENLTEEELQILRAEDDIATITLDGQVIEIEQFFNLIAGAIAAATNAIVEGVSYVVEQVVTGEEISPGGLVGSITTGALNGALTVATGGAAAPLIGAATSAVGNVVEQSIDIAIDGGDFSEFSGTDVGVEALSAVIPGLDKLRSKKTKELFNELEPYDEKVVSREILETSANNVLQHFPKEKVKDLLNPEGEIDIQKVKDSLLEAPTTSSNSNYIVGGYFPEWGIYGRDFQVEDIPADKLTHLFYAFAQIDNNGEVAIFDEWAATDTPFLNEATGEAKYTYEQSQANEAGNFAELQKLKAENPNLNLMLSIGGWSLSGPFSTVASTDASREKFAKSAVDFMVEYGFDGLDIDWEYPGEGGATPEEVEALAPTRINKEVTNSPDDKYNYTLLLAELDEQIQIQEAVDGKDYQLSIASPAGFENIENLELAEIAEHIDFFNLMAYDFHGSTWEADTTNHQAALFANPDDPSEAEIVDKFNIHSAVEAYLDAGVAPQDIVLGAPLYGRAWTGVSNDANDGLFQSATGAASGTWEEGVLDYKDLYNRLETQPEEYSRYWDDEAKAPYIFAPSVEGGLFSTYEDSESIGLKTNYIKNMGLGGMFFWDLSSDLPGNNNDSLINNAYQYLTLGEPYVNTPTEV